MFLPSTATLLLGALCISLVFYISTDIYAALSSPLSSIPGPWYAAVSNAWLNSHFFRFNQAQALHQLFQQYGPIVRVGPQKVVFCDLESTRNVYTVHRFEKAPVYSNFKIEGVDQSLSLLDNAAHASRRRAVGSHYTAANVARLVPRIHRSTLEAIHRLHVICGGTVVDSLDLMRMLMLDITASSTFGYTIGAVQNWTLDEPSRISFSIADFAPMAMLSGMCNTWVWRAICLVPLKRVTLFTQTISFLKAFVTEKAHEAKEQLKEAEEFEHLPFIHRMLKYRNYLTNEALSSEAAVAETVAHLLAGADPTSATLAYFLWEISRNPEVSNKLRAEIDAVMPDADVIPELSVLHELSYLTAFIQEALRVYTVVPILLERVVPATGDVKLMGHYLPPGTIVGTQAWSMHKNPAVFPEPERFSPERWLDDTEPWRSLREEHLMPFGLGSRACVGQQLAQASFRVILAAVVRNFNLSAAPTTTSDSMSPQIAGFPRAGECKLVFTQRNE
ncbi:cytochrome P450 [Mycena rebaudengoi]|nr:cytochrome P450 [Mycena rebaudengoi]